MNQPIAAADLSPWILFRIAAGSTGSRRQLPGSWPRARLKSSNALQALVPQREPFALNGPIVLTKNNWGSGEYFRIY